MKTGDIFAFYNERLERWHACQITGFHEDSKDKSGKPRPAVLVLDWSESRLPACADFFSMKALISNWPDGLFYRYCTGLKPKCFTYCGNHSLLTERNVDRLYGRWFRVEEIFPPKKTIAQHQCSTYESNKERLDFRGTDYLPPQIDITGVKEIYLHDAVSRLLLVGTFEPDLQIHDPHNGRYLDLHLWGADQIPKGIEHLQRLLIAEITDINITETFEAHREIDELWLSGKSGNIKNFSTISMLKKLRWLVVQDLYGFSAEDMPTPQELPALESLWMHSVPFDVAQTAKKLYKPLVVDGFELDILKARKPEWIAENSNNPFRSWDGDEMLPRGCAKKAFEIYKKTRSGLVSVCKSEGVDVQHEALALCRAYIDVFNAMDRKHDCLDTVFAEQIMGALNELITEVTSEPSVIFDAALLIDESDAMREF